MKYTGISWELHHKAPVYKGWHNYLDSIKFWLALQHQTSIDCFICFLVTPQNVEKHGWTIDLSKCMVESVIYPEWGDLVAYPQLVIMSSNRSQDPHITLWACQQVLSFNHVRLSTPRTGSTGRHQILSEFVNPSRHFQLHTPHWTLGGKTMCMYLKCLKCMLKSWTILNEGTWVIQPPSLCNQKPKPGFTEHNCGHINKFPSSNLVRLQHLDLSTRRHQTLLDFFYSLFYLGWTCWAHACTCISNVGMHGWSTMLSWITNFCLHNSMPANPSCNWFQSTQSYACIRIKKSIWKHLVKATKERI